MLKILSSEYQLYACGKIFSHALILNENSRFAKGSNDWPVLSGSGQIDVKSDSLRVGCIAWRQTGQWRSAPWTFDHYPLGGDSKPCLEQSAAVMIIADQITKSALHQTVEG
jgi:hypothetical protein